MNQYQKYPVTKLKRRPDRASYDEATIHAILDSALMCHVAYSIDGVPHVTPTIFWRDGRALYWHGAPAGRMLRHLRDGAPVSVNVTLCDGIVYARSAFHHSMNYRSVTAFGDAMLVTDTEEKRRQLDLLIEKVGPGRSDQVRKASPRELRLTTLIRLNLDQVVAKSRSGPPGDDEADMDIPVWTGVLPTTRHGLAPVDDPLLMKGLSQPDFLKTLHLE